MEAAIRGVAFDIELAVDAAFGDVKGSVAIESGGMIVGIWQSAAQSDPL